MSLFDAAQPAWGRIPPVNVTGAATVSGDHVAIPTDAGVLAVSLHLFGLRLRFGADRTADLGIVVGVPPALTPVISAAPNETTITAGDDQVVIGHAPLSFAYSQRGRAVQSSPTDGHFVRRFRMPPFARIPGGWFASFDLATDTPVYGLGEKWGRLDKRGQLIRSFNQDALGVNAEWSYKNAPFAWSPGLPHDRPQGWGVFVHTGSAVTHGVGHALWSQRAYGIAVEDDVLDLFVLAAPDGAGLIERYTEITGRAVVPPIWSLGAILSKAYYKDADELLSVAREVRARHMPCDVITLDGRAWQDTDTRFAFEWDPKRYADPKPVIDALKALDFKICVWEYPLISIKNPLFAELAGKGWLLKDKRTGEAYRYQWDLEPFGKVLTPLPESGLLDFTHPDAYAFWRDAHKPLFDLGIDMIKADFGEQVDDHMIASNGLEGSALHNLYALYYNRCVYEAAARYCKSGPFLFSRSAWAGSQRYPSQWGGDPQADWEGFAASLRGGLSWGMSGGPYFATDVGGFYGDTRDAALYVRWLQAGIFSAHIRLHGIGPREPWSYGSEAEAAALAALQMRYRLVPYLRKALAQAASSGIPVQRAMVLAFPHERAAWSFETQFMCGDDLLVAPCIRADGRVDVYLPAGSWRRFPDGAQIAGGRAISLNLALSDMAVFARAPVALGPAAETTAALTRV